jgi:c(7)-type cytochrome triheme protein
MVTKACIALILIVLLASLGIAKIGGGDVLFFESKTAGDVLFSHESHVAGAALQCTHCHDRLYVTKEKDKRIAKAAMQKGKSCGACHDGKKAFDVKSNCKNCHK